MHMRCHLFFSPREFRFNEQQGELRAPDSQPASCSALKLGLPHHGGFSTHEQPRRKEGSSLRTVTCDFSHCRALTSSEPPQDPWWGTGSAISVLFGSWQVSEALLLKVRVLWNNLEAPLHLQLFSITGDTPVGEGTGLAWGHLGS